MVFMSKIHQFFLHLAYFSQNSINTNKIEIGDSTFETKQVSVAVKLASNFFAKMQEHIDDNSILKDVPAFTKSFFAEATGGGSLLHHRPLKLPSQSPTSQPKQTAEGSAKVTARPSKAATGQKKQRNISDKSLKMGLFHMKKGTPTSKALPEKSTLKEGEIFVATRESATTITCYARTGSITPIGKMFPKKISPSCLCTWQSRV
jgi:hypothetical protein